MRVAPVCLSRVCQLINDMDKHPTKPQPLRRLHSSDFLEMQKSHCHCLTSRHHDSGDICVLHSPPCTGKKGNRPSYFITSSTIYIYLQGLPQTFPTSVLLFWDHTPPLGWCTGSSPAIAADPWGTLRRGRWPGAGRGRRGAPWAFAASCKAWGMIRWIHNIMYGYIPQFGYIIWIWISYICGGETYPSGIHDMNGWMEMICIVFEAGYGRMKK